MLPKLFILISFVGPATHAFALPPVPRPLTKKDTAIVKVRFYLPAALPDVQEIKNLPRVISSSIGFLSLGMSQIGRCSGTVISSQGYALSARHCFDRCFDERLALSDPVVQPNGNTIRKVDRSKFP